MGLIRVEQATCLGCGCGCDDVAVRIDGGVIVDLTPPCPLAREWFGDGSAGDRVLVSGQSAEPAAAIAEAARVLAGARSRVLVGIGTDLSSQAQREAVAIADLLGGTVDTATSPAAAAGLLAAQRRGRATATLGEIRNRADVVLFWAVDPGTRYPRYLSRYALDPAGTHIPQGRRGRTVISANVGGAR